jgi:hypothetical protein
MLVVTGPEDVLNAICGVDDTERGLGGYTRKGTESAARLEPRYSRQTRATVVGRTASLRRGQDADW